MIVGILSDTHDRADAMAEGMRVLSAAGPAFFIHCGDVGGQRVLDYLAGTKSLFVFGNTDWDRRGLARYAQDLGIQCGNTLAEIELDGRQFAVTHGDDPRTVRRILDEQRHDYLLVGHSHVRQDQRVGRVRVINPGALHRAAEKTVAVLDTATDRLRYITIKMAGR